MAFKVFDAYGAASRPEATFRLSGYLFLSRGILKRADCEKATHAQLLFDEDEDVLAISLSDTPMDLVEDGYREAILEKSGIAVNVLPLLRYFGFPDAKVIGKRVLPVTFRDTPGSKLILIDMKELRPAAKPQKAAGSSGDFDDDALPF